MTTAHATIIPICCACGLIRETHGARVESWVTRQVFSKTHRGDLSDYRLTHTYCPACYAEFMDRIAAA